MHSVVQALNSACVVLLSLIVLSVFRIELITPASSSQLQPRQDPPAAAAAPSPTPTLAPATQAQQDAIVALASSDPVAAAGQAQSLPYMEGSYAQGNLWAYDLVSGDGNAQLPWNRQVPFSPLAAVDGSDTGGWQFLPQLDSFTLNRTLPIGSHSTHIKVVGRPLYVPFYITSDYDPAKVKRAVMIMPGKPRDCWKYTMLVRNALNVVVSQGQPGASNDSVIIVGVCWLDENDKNAGSVMDREVYFKESSWQRGGPSLLQPDDYETTHVRDLTSYDVLDSMLDWLFDKRAFPAMNRVVVAGHSMGAQCVQRYSMLKKTRAYDSNVFFWIGNPGSVVFPTDDRTYPNASCTKWNDWPYGLGNVSSVPNYARLDVNASREDVVNRYLNRNVHLALGLLDNGQGDTHCQAMMQGWNHLNRGCQLVFAETNASGGTYPSLTHSVDFVANTSHQDYQMLSTNVSLWRLFNDRLDSRDPELTDTTNPGDALAKALRKEQKKKKFSTPTNVKLANSLLYGSLGFIALAYALLPWIFGHSRNDEFQEDWAPIRPPLYQSPPQIHLSDTSSSLFGTRTSDRSTAALLDHHARPHADSPSPPTSTYLYR